MRLGAVVLLSIAAVAFGQDAKEQRIADNAVTLLDELAGLGGKTDDCIVWSAMQLALVEIENELGGAATPSGQRIRQRIASSKGGRAMQEICSSPTSRPVAQDVAMWKRLLLQPSLGEGREATATTATAPLHTAEQHTQDPANDVEVREPQRSPKPSERRRRKQTQGKPKRRLDAASIKTAQFFPGNAQAAGPGIDILSWIDETGEIVVLVFLVALLGFACVLVCPSCCSTCAAQPGSLLLAAATGPGSSGRSSRRRTVVQPHHINPQTGAPTFSSHTDSSLDKYRSRGSSRRGSSALESAREGSKDSILRSRTMHVVPSAQRPTASALYRQGTG